MRQNRGRSYRHRLTTIAIHSGVNNYVSRQCKIAPPGQKCMHCSTIHETRDRRETTAILWLENSPHLVRAPCSLAGQSTSCCSCNRAPECCPRREVAPPSRSHPTGTCSVQYIFIRYIHRYLHTNSTYKYRIYTVRSGYGQRSRPSTPNLAPPLVSFGSSVTLAKFKNVGCQSEMWKNAFSARPPR